MVKEPEAHLKGYEPRFSITVEIAVYIIIAIIAGYFFK